MNAFFFWTFVFVGTFADITVAGKFHPALLGVGLLFLAAQVARFASNHVIETRLPVLERVGRALDLFNLGMGAISLLVLSIWSGFLAFHGISRMAITILVTSVAFSTALWLWKTLVFQTYWKANPIQ